MNGTATGPSNAGDGECLLGWVFGDENFCPNCADRTACSDCQNDPNCIFCSDQTCVDNRPDLPSTCTPALTDTCKCEKRLSCTDCQPGAGDLSCYWCPEKRRCFSPQDPLPPGCSTNLTHACPACSATTNCQICAQQSGCGWCGGKCQEDVLCPGGEGVANCDEFCRTLTDCEPCIFTEGCSWCADKNECEGADIVSLKPCTMYQHSCPRAASFDAGSFFGGIALVVGLVGVAVLIFFAFRHFKRRSDYSTV